MREASAYFFRKNILENKKATRRCPKQKGWFSKIIYTNNHHLDGRSCRGEVLAHFSFLLYVHYRQRYSFLEGKTALLPGNIVGGNGGGHSLKTLTGPLLSIPTVHLTIMGPVPSIVRQVIKALAATAMALQSQVFAVGRLRARRQAGSFFLLKLGSGPYLFNILVNIFILSLIRTHFQVLHLRHAYRTALPSGTRDMLL